MNLKDNELSKIKDCYGYLFQIELSIKNTTRKILIRNLGREWKCILRKKYQNNLMNKELEEMYLHELISFINMIPILKDEIQLNKIPSITDLIKIRNKIAHCVKLNDKEQLLLVKIYHDILSI